MKHTLTVFAVGLLLLAGALPAVAGGVTFQEIAGPGTGLDYAHGATPRLDVLLDFYSDGFVHVVDEYFVAPHKPFGAPGVALLDFDGDGDLDLYVTNGPGSPNSLFSNQLRETGATTFVDVAAAAGVDATDQESQGVCFGDVDNDGDPDLYVLGGGEANRLFENQGDGTFTDITVASGTGGGERTSTSCSMGDVDGDGLLDLFVVNAFDFTQQLPYTLEPFALNQHNQLFLNTGGNLFADVSAAAGVEDLPSVPVPGAALVSWAAAVVDLDMDGDQDLLVGEDQRTLLEADPPFAFPRFHRNDGTGTFSDATAEAGLDRPGSWKGLSVGDLDCDGGLDLFASNLGDYILFPGLNPPGAFASRWFLSQAGGGFADPGPGDLVTVPTGWGTSLADYDNDGDLDVILHGGLDHPLFLDESNPGVILDNQGCSATFQWDAAALAGSTDHTRRNVQGMAVGDLNDDGFLDVVSVSSLDLPADAPLAPLFSNPLGSVFDPAGLGVYTTVPTDNPLLFQVVWYNPVAGSLSVELNSGANGNGSVSVRTLGTVGLVSGAVANRDGIGAVVRFTPAPGLPGTAVTRPVMGGSSYASQDSLTAHFGLGQGRRGSVEVLWPGGVRNRLYGVRAGERVLFPEIPCSFADEWDNLGEYAHCVLGALGELDDGGVLDRRQAARYLVSAIHAYLAERGLPFTGLPFALPL